MNYFDKYKVSVPEGQLGVHRVERFTVSKEDAKWESMRSVFSGGRAVPEGTYTRLMRDRTLVMSDTPDEIRDHLGFIGSSYGHVLIAGLGLGMVLQAVVRRPEVKAVTVVEIERDVIKLVGDHYLTGEYGEKISFVNEDIFTWKTSLPAYYFDCAWFDIWDTPCTDNLEEMAKLHRRFARRAKEKGSWGRELLRAERRRRA